MDSFALAGAVWAGMDIGHLLALIIILFLVRGTLKEGRQWFKKDPPAPACPPTSDPPLCRKDLELVIEKMRNEFREDLSAAISGLGERFGKALTEHDNGNQRDFKAAEESNSRRFAAVEKAIEQIGKRMDDLVTMVAGIKNNGSQTKE